MLTNKNASILARIKYHLLSKGDRWLIFFGIACTTSPYYVDMMIKAKRMGIFIVENEQTNNIFEINMAFTVFILGVIFILIGMSILSNRNFGYAISLIITVILLITTLFVNSFSLSQTPSPIGWAVSLFNWVMSVFFICEFVYLITSNLLKKFMSLENKEQFTIGIAVFTFLLGLLVGK